jgi:hypothetical protein
MAGAHEKSKQSSPKPNPADIVAERMFEALIDTQVLRQKHAVRIILKEFGDAFLYKNARNHWAIDASVLSAFADLTGDSVVWEKSKQRWRRRRPGDKPGRQQR